MGSKLVSDSQPRTGVESENDTTPHSYTETFYEHLPYYLAMGMTLDEFFNQDCTLVKYYRETQQIKKEQRNQELWLQGLYIYEALGDMSPVLRAFSKKGTKPLPYPSEPYPITKAEAMVRKEREEQLQAEKVKAKLYAWAAKTNAHFANSTNKEVR